MVRLRNERMRIDEGPCIGKSYLLRGGARRFRREPVRACAERDGSPRLWLRHYLARNVVDESGGLVGPVYAALVDRSVAVSEDCAEVRIDLHRTPRAGDPRERHGERNAVDLVLARHAAVEVGREEHVLGRHLAPGRGEVMRRGAFAAQSRERSVEVVDDGLSAVSLWIHHHANRRLAAEELEVHAVAGLEHLVAV